MTHCLSQNYRPLVNFSVLDWAPTSESSGWKATREDVDASLDALVDNEGNTVVLVSVAPKITLIPESSAANTTFEVDDSTLVVSVVKLFPKAPRLGDRMAASYLQFTVPAGNYTCLKDIGVENLPISGNCTTVPSGVPVSVVAPIVKQAQAGLAYQGFKNLLNFYNLTVNINHDGCYSFADESGQLSFDKQTGDFRFWTSCHLAVNSGQYPSLFVAGNSGERLLYTGPAGQALIPEDLRHGSSIEWTHDLLTDTYLNSLHFDWFAQTRTPGTMGVHDQFGFLLCTEKDVRMSHVRTAYNALVG